MSTHPVQHPGPIPTPKEWADIALNVLQKPNGAAMLARGFQAFVLGLAGWSVADEPGDKIVYVAHDPSDESTKARNPRILAEYQDVLASIEAFYSEMDRKLPGDHDEEVPDWEDWTLKLWSRLRPFFHRWDIAKGRIPPPQKRPNVALALVAEAEADVLTARLNVEFGRVRGQYRTEMVNALRFWKLEGLDRHLRVTAEELWVRRPTDDRPFTRKDRRPKKEVARRLVAKRFADKDEDALDPETIGKYVRQAEKMRLP
jgi:hypothetical protein